jgi:thiamine pyrophosphate-dependent acetolactate synthase large subunit-like protein
VGGGVVRANGLKHYNSWRNFSTTSNDHFNGKSSYNEKDHLSLGMLGMHGTAYAIMLLVNVIY